MNKVWVRVLAIVLLVALVVAGVLIFVPFGGNNDTTAAGEDLTVGTIEGTTIVTNDPSLEGDDVLFVTTNGNDLTN